jgi:hypothetical protein
LPVGGTKKRARLIPRARIRLGLSLNIRRREISGCGAAAQTSALTGVSIAALLRPRYVSPVFAAPSGDRMTTFDDREKAFEKKFALDQEQEFKASVRRNRALAQWAAGLMGLEGKHVEEYTRAVVKSDLEAPGDEDVLRKVFEDLKGAGVQVTEGEVRMRMAELMAQARESVRAGE